MAYGESFSGGFSVTDSDGDRVTVTAETKRIDFPLDVHLDCNYSSDIVECEFTAGPIPASAEIGV